MAHRRCFQTLTRSLHSHKSLSPISQSLIIPATSSSRLFPHSLSPLNPTLPIPDTNLHISTMFTRHFSSKNTDDEYEDDESGEEEEEDYDDDDDVDSEEESSSVAVSDEDKLKEASEIGYTVIGPLHKTDRVFKPYEPVFAVVQIGAHQFKVSNGDCIYTERLKYCNVNDKLVLNKVLMLGSKSQTMIGRPILPDAAVHAVVEEHALDAKVIIFKKKRRKNYRRTKGHRQELTKLRITDIQGIDKPETTLSLKTEKKEKPGKVEVGA